MAGIHIKSIVDVLSLLDSGDVEEAKVVLREEVDKYRYEKKIIMRKYRKGLEKPTRNYI